MVQRWGGTERRCTVLIILAGRNNAHACTAGLQTPQYGQPSVTSPPFVRQPRPHARDQRHWHARPAHPCFCTDASDKSQSGPKLAVCYLSPFRENTSKPSMYAQEIIPVTHLLDRRPNQDSNPGPSAAQTSIVTIQQQRLTNDGA